MVVFNAGQKLWETQKAQGTGLCLGLDPHGDRPGERTFEQLYRRFTVSGGLPRFREIVLEARKQQLFAGADPNSVERVYTYLAGVTGYFTEVIDAAWACGIRVFKPQAAFYERLAPFGDFVLSRLCRRIDDLAKGQCSRRFTILDAKRGDIASTQEPYYAAYLSGFDEEVYPGMTGQFGFDAITVTTWMGDDVLTPGLPYFRTGRGAIVVTRTSNPSGTTYQDLQVSAQPDGERSPTQAPFAVPFGILSEIEAMVGHPPSTQEVMLYCTSVYCRKQHLDQDGISPIFSVVGSTVRADGSFRQLRPGGIALVPGFGAQGGAFDNIMPLHVADGPLGGHLGILSSSRAHNYPWMREYGGEGKPANLRWELERSIDQFRTQEQEAYLRAGLDYPYA